MAVEQAVDSLERVSSEGLSGPRRRSGSPPRCRSSGSRRADRQIWSGIVSSIRRWTRSPMVQRCSWCSSQRPPRLARRSHSAPRARSIAKMTPAWATVSTCPSGCCRAMSGQRVHDPRLDQTVVLPPGGPLARFEVAGELHVDLVAGESLPFAGMAFHQAIVQHHRADADALGDEVGRRRGAVQRRGVDRVDRSHRAGRVGGLSSTEFGQRRVLLSLPSPVRVPLGLTVAHHQNAGHGGRR